MFTKNQQSKIEYFSAPCSPGYRIRRAFPSDAEAIEYMMNTAWSALEDKDWFIQDDASFIRRILGESGSPQPSAWAADPLSASSPAVNGFGLLALDTKDAPAAYLLVLFPELSSENLGYDLAFKKRQLLQAAHMDSSAVLPNHRGQQLQQSLVRCAEEILQQHFPGKIYLLATVAPANLPSLKSFQACSYEIRGTKEKYGGVTRHILFKKI